MQTESVVQHPLPPPQHTHTYTQTPVQTVSVVQHPPSSPPPHTVARRHKRRLSQWYSQLDNGTQQENQDGGGHKSSGDAKTDAVAARLMRVLFRYCQRRRRERALAALSAGWLRLAGAGVLSRTAPELAPTD